MAQNRSPLYELLAERLDKDPVADIRERRGRGETWRSIMITYQVDHAVSVTDMTLRTWVAAEDAGPEERTAAPA